MRWIKQTPVTAEELARFKAYADPIYWEYLPDDLVVSTLAFAVWRFTEAMRELGRSLFETLPDWIKRRLK